MDNDFMPALSAMSYLGLDSYDELERLVVEHDVEVDFDQDGVIVAVQGGAALKEALFENHKRTVGYRPDDLKATEHIRKAAESKAEERRVFRRTMRQGLARRVARRAAIAQEES